MFFFDSIYRKDTRPARFLCALAVSGIAYGLYRGVQDNYLVEFLGVNPFERGLIEFFREIPGLLLVFILALMYRFSESKVFKIGIGIMLGGIVGLCFSPALKAPVVVCMVIFSFGEHIIMPVRSSISLHLAQPSKGGASLGVTATISNLGNIAGYLLVTLFFLVVTHLGVMPNLEHRFKLLFAVSSALMTAGIFIALAIKDTHLKTERRRFFFARKFTTYYLLEVFYGARKQVFFTFGPLVLIVIYGAQTSTIALLLAVCAGAAMIFSPLIGRLIDRIGFKAVMVGDTLILIIVCFFYGFSHRLFTPEAAFLIVCVNFVFDAILSLGSMATNVYVQSLAQSREEVTATLSTGISVNHLISILIALFGGFIWKSCGIEILFSFSALLGLISSLYAASIKTVRAA